LLHRRQQRLVVEASKGLSSNGVYSATKVALSYFARTWTTNLNASRIRVTAADPGPIHTPRPSGTLAFKKAGQKRLKMISNTASLGGLAT
jgi:NAD(P)-dependent dehydrogenase (short-subunit alcohol dehydrogenase family)